MKAYQLFSKWIEEVWNQSNTAYINETLDENIVIHGLDPTGISVGKDAFISFYENIRRNFEELHIDFDNVVSNDQVATLYCTVTGISVDGNKVHFNGITSGKFANEKLVEVWNVFDFLKMYQQMGHILVSQIQ